MKLDTSKLKEPWRKRADWEQKNKVALKTMPGKEFWVRLLAYNLTDLKRREAYRTFESSNPDEKHFDHSGFEPLILLPRQTAFQIYISVVAKDNDAH